MTLSPIEAARLLHTLGDAAESLESYCGFVELPGRPVGDDDGELFEPVESSMALHHRLIVRACQRCMEKRYGRLLILAPPGSAKSTYATVAAPTWFMGRRPGSRIIIASHNSTIATKQSKKARSICRSARYAQVFEASLPNDSRAADEWSLTNGSQLMSGGILSGITGNRAEGVVADDLLSGREAAESDVIRTKVWEAWKDDLRSRLVAGGWAIHIMTRWHQGDVGGMILPTGWNGESGVFTGSDGLEWEVLSLAARIESPLQVLTDPMGRGMGEYLWPENFTREHWVQVDPALGAVETNTPTGRRTWASMYQQQPTPDTGVLFRREDVQWYEPDASHGSVDGRPVSLRFYGASDYAVTDEELSTNDPDYTEHGVGGMDDKRHLWLVDWDYLRKETDRSVASAVALEKQWRTSAWFGEQGVIEKSIGPAVREARNTGRCTGDRILLPVSGHGSKVARVRSFQVMWEEKRVHIPRTPWGMRLVEQLLGFPGLKHDDAVDVCSLMGRGITEMWTASPAGSSVREKALPGPLTYEWWERQAAVDKREAAEKESYFD